MGTDPRQDSTMPRRAYSYDRVSSATQGRGDGLRRQSDYAEEIAATEGWCLDDTLRFVDRGRSGFHGANLSPTADLTRFLDLVKRGRISPGSVLIIENIDRLSRQDVDVAYDLFRGLIRAGIWIATKMPQRVYRRESNSFMDLMEPIWLMYLAHQESLKKSQRITAAWETARKDARARGKPVNALPPAWIRKENGIYNLISDRAATMRRICRWACEGLGYFAICSRLTAEGVASFHRSGRWNQTSLKYTLRGRALVGEYQPHQLRDGKRVPCGDPIPNFYPALLSEDEWLRVQAAINGRKRKCGRPVRNRLNLFTGLMFDANRRAPLALHACMHRAGPHYTYLTCRGAGGVRIRYEDAEEAILDTLAILRPEDVLEPSAQQSEREQQIAALTGRLVALDHRQGQLQVAAADPDQDAAAILPVLRQVAADRGETARQLETLKLESLTGRSEALAEVQTLTQVRERLQGEERRELDRRIKAALPSVVSEIWVQQQRLSPRTHVAHIQIYLRSGNCRYVRLSPPDLRGAKPWPLDGVDLRVGPYVPTTKVCHRAKMAKSP